MPAEGASLARLHRVFIPMLDNPGPNELSSEESTYRMRRRWALLKLRRQGSRVPDESLRTSQTPGTDA